MSLFNVPVMTLESVEPHPNADKLDLAVIGGYRAVVQKGLHKAGDTILYIPEDSVFTDLSIAEKLNVGNYLVGKNKDRVKAIRLRGILSQGIVLPASALRAAFGGDFVLEPGADLSEKLGIIKYEEPIPANMAGVARTWPSFLPHYDIENVKRPEFLPVIAEGEDVVMTEKVHGANMSVAWGPGLEDGERAYVCSKNTALMEAEGNAFWIAAHKYGLIDKLEQAIKWTNEVRRRFDGNAIPVQNISFHGELLGVQDLKYGFNTGNPGFVLFDVRVDYQFLDYEDFLAFAQYLDIPTVPELYRGPFRYDILEGFCEQDSALCAGIRGGLVIKPTKERRHDESGLGRVVLKYVGARYLSRKGGTELH